MPPWKWKLLLFFYLNHSVFERTRLSITGLITPCSYSLNSETILHSETRTFDLYFLRSEIKILLTVFLLFQFYFKESLLSVENCILHIPVKGYRKYFRSLTDITTCVKIGNFKLGFRLRRVGMTGGWRVRNL